MPILIFIIGYFALLGLSTTIVLFVLIKQYVDFSNSVEGKETMTYWDIRIPRFFMFIAMRIMEVGEKLDFDTKSN